MDVSEVSTAIAEIREIKGTQIFYDVHVHPFEVMYQSRAYHPAENVTGVYCSGPLSYASPKLGELDLEAMSPDRTRADDSKLRSMACLFNARKAYSHIGPRVIGDQMELAIVDRAVLLPVLKHSDGDANQSPDLAAMFGKDDRFLLGYCLPSTVPVEGVVEAVGRAVERFGVRVLKIHPSITGLDLGSPAGVRTVEALLEASRQHRLKVVIHGGRSPECPDRQAANFGVVSHLQRIDWSLTPETVIIAHGGCFGYSAAEAITEVLPVMEQLLARHAHLAVDTSAIKGEVLCPMLERFDLERIYFGSDALYEKEWGAMVTLWCALRQTLNDGDEALRQIAGSNPGRLFAA